MSQSNPEEISKEDAAVIAKAIKMEQLKNRMIAFYKKISADDCAGLSGQGEKTQFTAPHTSKAPRAFHQSADYTAVELMVDFKAAIDQRNWDAAIEVYFPLRRMLHW